MVRVFSALLHLVFTLEGNTGVVDLHTLARIRQAGNRARILGYEYLGSIVTADDVDGLDVLADADKRNLFAGCDGLLGTAEDDDVDNLFTIVCGKFYSLVKILERLVGTLHNNTLNVGGARVFYGIFSA